MKTVFVQPERCVGCRQCMLECAIAHSQSQTLHGAVSEEVLSLPRIHVGSGPRGEAFPNRCRHCEPAPCELACFPRAIRRDAGTGTIEIESRRCIGCASCAMACPFGVIRFHADPRREGAKLAPHKCDNCMERLERGRVPACVESCKTGALVFRDINEVLEEKTREVASKTTLGLTSCKSREPGSGMELLRALRASMADMSMK